MTQLSRSFAETESKERQQLERDMGVKTGLFFFFNKYMGEITANVYADVNDPGRRENQMIQREGTLTE